MGVRLALVVMCCAVGAADAIPQGSTGALPRKPLAQRAQHRVAGPQVPAQEANGVIRQKVAVAPSRRQPHGESEAGYTWPAPDSSSGSGPTQAPFSPPTPSPIKPWHGSGSVDEMAKQRENGDDEPRFTWPAPDSSSGSASPIEPWHGSGSVDDMPKDKATSLLRQPPFGSSVLRAHRRTDGAILASAAVAPCVSGRLIAIIAIPVVLVIGVALLVALLVLFPTKRTTEATAVKTAPEPCCAPQDFV